MATAVRPSSPHTAVDQLLTLATLSLTVSALLLALLQFWAGGAVVALLAVLVGGAAQLVSETRTERFVIIFGVTLSAVILMVCLASGGTFVS